MRSMRFALICNVARFRRRTSHVPNLIDELGTAELRATYEQ
jgi:hypothetical protein